MRLHEKDARWHERALCVEQAQTTTRISCERETRARNEGMGDAGEACSGITRRGCCAPDEERAHESNEARHCEASLFVEVRISSARREHNLANGGFITSLRNRAHCLLAARPTGRAHCKPSSRLLFLAVVRPRKTSLCKIIQVPGRLRRRAAGLLGLALFQDYAARCTTCHTPD